MPAPARFHFLVAGTAPPFNRASFTSTPGPDIGEACLRAAHRQAMQAGPPAPCLHGICKTKLCSEYKDIPALVQGSRVARFHQH